MYKFSYDLQTHIMIYLLFYIQLISLFSPTFSRQCHSCVSRVTVQDDEHLADSPELDDCFKEQQASSAYTETCNECYELIYGYKCG